MIDLSKPWCIHPPFTNAQLMTIENMIRSLAELEVATTHWYDTDPEYPCPCCEIIGDHIRLTASKIDAYELYNIQRAINDLSELIKRKGYGSDGIQIDSEGGREENGGIVPEA